MFRQGPFAEAALRRGNQEVFSDDFQLTWYESFMLIIDVVLQHETQASVKAKLDAIIGQLHQIDPSITIEVKTVYPEYPVEVANVQVHDLKKVLALLRSAQLIPQGWDKAGQTVNITVYRGIKEK